MSTSRSSENQGDPDEARRFSVLVVSDRDEERDQLERIVDAAGLDVEGCSSSAAQAMLAANGPDVALCVSSVMIRICWRTRGDCVRRHRCSWPDPRSTCAN